MHIILNKKKVIQCRWRKEFGDFTMSVTHIIEENLEKLHCPPESNITEDELSLAIKMLKK